MDRIMRFERGAFRCLRLIFDGLADCEVSSYNQPLAVAQLDRFTNRGIRRDDR